MNDKVEQISYNVYLVNNKNTVVNNKKNLRCNCKWFDDNKGHTRYCHCCLSVLHFIDKEKFWEEIRTKKEVQTFIKNYEQRELHSKGD